MSYVEIILNYLKAFLNSWPLIILITFIVYKKQISSLLNRVYKGKFYGASFEATSTIQRKKFDNVEKFENLKKQQEAIKYCRENPKEAVNYYTSMYTNLYKAFVFEKAFNVVFGTQIRLLEDLEQQEGISVEKSQLNVFYKEYLNRTNPLYKRSTQQEYFAFLYYFKFIEDINKNSHNYTQISNLGKEFLIYIRKQYPLIYPVKVF